MGARASGARLAALLSLVTSACAPLDRRPPHLAFARSRQALERASRSTEADRGAVEVGWARAGILAPAGAPLAGYASRSGEAHRRVHDPIFARALAVRVGGGSPLVFLALDLLLLDPETSTALAERVADAIPRARLLMSATHTHGGLGGFARGMAWELATGPFTPEARRAILEAGERAIREAVATLAPGRLALGEVDAPGLNKNRIRRSGAPTDPCASLLLLERSRDRARAMLVAFAAHATIVSDQDPDLTADYPGALVARLEARGLDLAAFAAGAVGSMAPAAGWAEHPGVVWTAERLAAAIARAIPSLERALRAETALAVVRTEIRLPRRQWRIGDEWVISDLLIGGLMPSTVHLQAVSFGRETWAALPVELSGEIARSLKARARARGELLAISVFNGEYGGYVVPRAAYDLREEEKGEMADYETHVMSFFGPWMGDLFAAATWRTARAASEAARRAWPETPRPPPLVLAPAAGRPPPELTK
ncbi:MAG: neutral/alkaline non-lysosomal ceramidase N-terminal domain-containing protein [Deltaproteobacteria bacterium]|nr:neutral/alkaline non-lysosomal ceramidase N-terminal domain-containing protein [Deltaproteobacteria bacterium]